MQQMVQGLDKVRFLWIAKQRLERKAMGEDSHSIGVLRSNAFLYG